MILRALVFTAIGAALATPCAGQTPTPAIPDSVRILRNRTAMVSDLRNFVTAQEAYFADYLKYAAKMSDIARSYRPTEGVTVVLLTGAATSHSAIAIHRDSPDLVCAIAIGVGIKNPLGTADEARVLCRLPDGTMYTR